MDNKDLIKEARDRGYRAGTPIRYVAHAIDYVEGSYFEVVNGQVKAYRKPKHERVCFEDMRHDTLFDACSRQPQLASDCTYDDSV